MKRTPTRRDVLRAGVAAAATLVSSRAALARGEERAAALRAQFEQRRRQVLHQAGTRHVEVGVWCRDAGLVPQATAEFLRAVEVSEGTNHWAAKVVDLMRRLEGKFWKKYENEKPSKGMLAAHEKRAKAATSAYRKDRLSLARWAEKQDLAEEAYGEYVGVLRGLGGVLDLDGEGRVLVEGTPLPAAISERLRGDAVTINDRLHVRDEFLALLPEVKTVHQAETERLRVRSERSAEAAGHLLALATAALDPMEDEVGGRPNERMTVYLFEDRKVYESYLTKTKMASHTPATGIADAGRGLVLVCAEGLDDDTTRGVVLHELAHLFQHGVTPVVMPSWYSEGFAESFGGTGAWRWDGKALSFSGDMPADRRTALAAAGAYLPLSTLLAADALDLITKDRAKARTFYDEAWAFYRYLKTGAPRAVASQFGMWEAHCRGAALGAQAGKPEAGSAAPAADLFRARLGGQLAEIETGFRAWLGAT